MHLFLPDIPHFPKSFPQIIRSLYLPEAKGKAFLSRNQAKNRQNATKMGLLLKLLAFVAKENLDHKLLLETGREEFLEARFFVFCKKQRLPGLPRGAL